MGYYSNIDITLREDIRNGVNLKTLYSVYGRMGLSEAQIDETFEDEAMQEMCDHFDNAESFQDCEQIYCN